jgi:hypothetical protein
VTFNGNNNTQTLAGTTTFNNLTINHTGTGSVTASGSTLTVSVLLHVQAGTFTSSSTFGAVQIDSGATLAGTNATTMTVNGAWTNNGTFTANGNTVALVGSAAQTIGGTSATPFGGLTINNSGPGVTLGNSASVAGLLTLSTDLTTTASFTLTLGNLATTAGSGDLWGNVVRPGPFTLNTTYAFGNPNVSLKFTSGAPPTSITYFLSRTVPSVSGFTTSVQRLYSFAPSGGGAFVATLRLHYLDSELNGNVEATLDLWRYAQPWIQVPATARDSTANWAESNAVSAFSLWTLSSAGSNAPTAVTVSQFEARTAMAEQPVSMPLLAALGGLAAAVVLAWTWQRKRR